MEYRRIIMDPFLSEESPFPPICVIFKLFIFAKSYSNRPSWNTSINDKSSLVPPASSSHFARVDMANNVEPCMILKLKFLLFMLLTIGFREAMSKVDLHPVGEEIGWTWRRHGTRLVEAFSSSRAYLQARVWRGGRRRGCRIGSREECPLSLVLRAVVPAAGKNSAGPNNPA